MRAALIATLTTVAYLVAMPAAVWAQSGQSASVSAPASPDGGTAAPSPADQLASLAGRRVHDIQIQGVPPVLDPQRLLSLLPQKPNEPLDKRKLRGSVQVLYATGRFQDVQVEAEPGPQNELSLVFVAKPNQFIGPLSVAGTPRHGPTPRVLLNAGKLQLGELLADARIQQAVSGMGRVLEDYGYYRFKIVPKFFPQEGTQQVAINFAVDPGPQARVGKIVLRGTPGYSPEEVEEIIKVHPGDPVNFQVLTRRLQRLRKKYQKQDRLEAQVSLVSRAFQPTTNSVDYTLDVVRGPTVLVQVEGARLERDVIKKQVPVYQENAVDDDLLNEGRRNLRDYLQTQGYFDARVGVVRKEQPRSDLTQIIYDVDRQERHKLLSVTFDGNKYFRADLLRERMQIQPAGWLLSHGLFSQALLGRDVASIEELYRSNGFQQVKVRPEVQDDHSGGKSLMRVILHIDEGPQALVRNLTILGAQTFSQSELEGLLASIPGQPFSHSNMVSDHDTLVNYYFNRGFPDVTMTYAATQVAGDPTGEDVTYTIHEGDRVYVNKVLVTGLHYTQPFVVDRKISTKAGEPLSQSEMLNTQSRLYDLGIFSGVDVAVQNPEGREAYKDVLLNITEAQRYTFIYGLGFEAQTGATPSGNNPQGRTGASPRVSFDVNRLNFRGRNDTIFFKSHVGRLQQRGLVGYEVPNWLDHDKLKFTFNTFYDNTRDVFTFTAQRLEASVQVQQTWSKATTLLYRLTYRNVKVISANIDPNLIPLLSRPEQVGVPSFTFIRDTRDDPINSRKGNYFVFDTGVGSDLLGSSTVDQQGVHHSVNFARFLLQHSEYFPFGYKGKYVVAHTTRIGIEQPWGNNPVIPLPERFFAGGGNSLRAFALNEAGPRDPVTGFQLGGEALFINDTELRFPPIPLPFIGKDMSPVAFYDMGNVFASTGTLFPSLLRWNQPNKQTCEIQQITSNPPFCSFNYLAHAVGGGIRYRTPIGPVRFDVGYNLNPPTFPVGRLGRSDVLHRVNFYFSIGQTF